MVKVVTYNCITVLEIDYYSFLDRLGKRQFLSWQHGPILMARRQPKKMFIIIIWRVGAINSSMTLLSYIHTIGVKGLKETACNNAALGEEVCLFAWLFSLYYSNHSSWTKVTWFKSCVNLAKKKQGSIFWGREF